MAKSIKLDNNLYWDTSSLHGGQIFQALANISATTRTFTVPNSFRGYICVFHASTGSGRNGIYAVVSTSGGSVTAEAIKAAAGATLTGGTNQLTITTTVNMYIYYIGNGIIS